MSDGQKKSDTCESDQIIETKGSKDIKNRNNNNNDEEILLPFRYYLEKMKNIKTIHLVIIPDDKKSLYYYDVKMTSVQQYLITIFDVTSTSTSTSNIKKSYELKISLPLHCKIEPKSTTIFKQPTKLNNSIEIKSKLLIDETNYDQHLFEDNVLDDHHSSSIDSINSITNLFKNNDNNDNEKVNLYCRYCLNSFIKSNDNDNSDINWKIKLLPSSNWVDLMDIWLCGCTGTTSFTDFPTGEINAIKDYCFIGDRFLLFHKDNTKDIIEDTTTTTTTTEKKDEFVNVFKESNSQWVPLKCKFCSSFIGSKDNNNNNNFRFYKHQISSSIFPPLPLSYDNNNYSNYNNNNNNNNLFKQYILETFIASQILTESQSSVTFKFLLVSSNKIYAMISLLNWETLFLTNYYIKNGNKKQEFIPVIKILFKSTIMNENNENNETDKKEIEKLINKWEFDFEAKKIYLPNEECFQLLEIMNYSNNLFTDDSKTLKNHNNFNLGILRLRLLD
ncbi:hypothetical protein DDB_G0291612 [Dictyostelium discoideum AX4]|uniref:HECT-type E3 ubiquitin transferase E3D n=1 Tax=Dictyostelium discoideum TaxID=44689 RepID=Q54EF6_DICDI|nr:hypothetical protein DDB_G0291612 [Dictyostelium discoideum AX4]EAL61790.1 hypothetical protein DDB_G0291612 [Dictyostelium discoideum AX4]|eukprot:XP_635284.1 hypothetical protein DDB_G0291612 [Dictyostelium discoideum AX4]